MSEIKTGGNAFPTVGSQYSHEDGMTLRDYFAAKAMQGLLSADKKFAFSHQEIALFAYQQADAMLAAAPELLDALEEMVNVAEGIDTAEFFPSAPLERALDAISKAKEEPFPQPSKKTGGDPCGECHLQAGETCDICGAIAKAKGE